MAFESRYTFSFAALTSCSVMRSIVEFCRDDDRIRLSHACLTTRGAIEDFIPNKTHYKTLTRPEVLPDLFSKSDDGVFSLGLPKNQRELHFNMAMLGHADLHVRGVPALLWFKTVTGLKPVVDLKRVLITKFLWSSSESVQDLTDHQMLVLRRRFEGGRDERIMIHDRQHWNLVRDMVALNSSICRFIFSSSPLDTGDNCFADIFALLSRRACATEYLDFCGPVTLATTQAFNLVAWGLEGLMLRRMGNASMSDILDLILSSPNEAKLTCLQFEGNDLDTSVERPMLNIVDALPITTLLFSKTSLTDGGYSRLFSTVGNSVVEKLYFRECDFSCTEVVQCLFLPTLSASSLLELTLSYMHIPDEATDALVSCLENSNFLTSLSLEGCDLGHGVLHGVVDGLKKSCLVTLDLRRNKIGCHAHNLFANVGNRGVLRQLLLDGCTLCKHASKDYKKAVWAYKRRKSSLKVSLKDCKLVMKRKRKNHLI